MLDLDTTFAVTSYEAGRSAGRMVIYGLIAAVFARVFRRWIRATFPRSVRLVLSLTVAGAILLAGINTKDAYDPANARAEMLAGCQDTADAQTRPLCGCLVDEVLTRNGTTRGDIARLEQETRAVERDGAPMPAVYQQARDACAGKAG